MYLRLVLALAVASYSTCALADLSNPQIRRSLVLGQAPGWGRLELERRTAWLNSTKNGTPRGVPLNRDAVAVLEVEKGKHPRYCFTYRGEPIRWGVCNTCVA